MPELPIFTDDQEAAEWFDTHDTSPYMDDLEEIEGVATHVKLTVSLRGDYLSALKQVAERKGIPYQTLIQMWLVEKLRQEAPDLL